MTKENKHIEINSDTISDTKEKLQIKDIDILKKDVKNNNVLLKHIDKFESSPLFENKKLYAGELLFNQGDIDNNFYIVKSGLLSVERYTTTQKTDTKELGRLKTGDFMGEGSITGENGKKEVLIKALENTSLLSIDAKNGLKKFIEENPTLGFELLKHIIEVTNGRLNESNKLITSSYEIEKTISNLDEINMKSIFALLDKIKDIADIDYILFFEKHTIMPDYLIYRYDSRQPNKMQDKIFEKKGYFIDLDELYEGCNITKDDFVVIQKLSIGKEVFGNIIFGREKRSFSGSDKKVFSSVANSFAGIIRKFITDKDEKNRHYIKEQQKNY